ncbi:MAG: aminoglycoside phosphotransferase family protein [Chloroflexi bacterium]|nr:aminoglycoside phosphotransferase family protein [Chloroflexota bacterium]
MTPGSSSPSSSTPTRPNTHWREQADGDALRNLLDELDIQPPGTPSFELVSEWAAKHVVRMDVDGKPWAYIRYLLGPASHYPDRWRHLEFGPLLFEARVGPRVLGLNAESESLKGRAVIIEAALNPISREDLEDRAPEAISLLARLHGNGALNEALSSHLTDADRVAFSPLGTLFAETRERWFEALAARWRAFDLAEIEKLLWVVNELMDALATYRQATGRISIVVPAHNDPNHGNFMVNRQGALRMIDFEEMSLNNPVADLGVFLTWYVDQDQHGAMLEENYPLASPSAVLDRMKVWVPLRYLGIAAHWAARMTRARDLNSYEYAANSLEEWLRGACELVYNGPVPPHLDKILRATHRSLLKRGARFFRNNR